MPVGPLLENNDVVELTFVSTYLSSTILNVWHFKAQLDEVIIDSGTFLDAFLTQVRSIYWDGAVGMKPLVSTDFNLNEIRTQIVYPTRRYYLKQTVNEPGTKAGLPAPSDIHLEVAMRTDAVGRGKTGNKKFTGLVLTDLNGPFWANATVTSWGDYAADFEAAIQPLPLDMNKIMVPIVWSRKRPIDRRTVIATTARPEVRVEPSRRVFQGI